MTHTDINQESVASSICLQGAIAEIVLYKALRTDWMGILEDLLTDKQGNPLAYSKGFRKLYKFDGQWQQNAVHAVHTQFWISRLDSSSPGLLDKWAALIESFIQPNGWIYNPQVSPTQLHTRMKSEYFMSFAMGIEILSATGQLRGTC